MRLLVRNPAGERRPYTPKTMNGSVFKIHVK